MINLYRMRRLMKCLIDIRWQDEQIMSKAAKVTSTITGMPRGGGNHSQVEDGAIQLEEIRAAYRESFEELEAMRTELDPLIDTLEDSDGRAAMRLRYIRGYSPEDIASAICRTPRTIYSYLSRAEDQLARKFPDQVSK